MSNFIRLIPTDPTWRPVEADAKAATAYAAWLYAGSEDPLEAVKAINYESIYVMDAGVNVDSVQCPVCGADVDISWVYDCISELWPDLPNLVVTLPCGDRASLNELNYDLPMGFASFEISMRAPNLGCLNAEELKQVSRLLGHPVRQILARY